MTFGHRPAARRNPAAGVLLCLGLLLASPGLAGESPWTLTQLTAALAREAGLSVRFSEERLLQYLTEPLILEGTLTFMPPDYLERQIEQPNWERMAVDGDLVSITVNWKDPPTRALLSDYPALDAFIVAVRSLLSGDQETLERVYATKLTGTQSDWRLRLAPRPAHLREAVSEIRVAGRAQEIYSIEVIEAGGDRSIITILGET